MSCRRGGGSSRVIVARAQREIPRSTTQQSCHVGAVSSLGHSVPSARARTGRLLFLALPRRYIALKTRFLLLLLLYSIAHPAKPHPHSLTRCPRFPLPSQAYNALLLIYRIAHLVSIGYWYFLILVIGPASCFFDCY